VDLKEAGGPSTSSLTTKTVKRKRPQMCLPPKQKGCDDCGLNTRLKKPPPRFKLKGRGGEVSHPPNAAGFHQTQGARNKPFFGTVTTLPNKPPKLGPLEEPKKTTRKLKKTVSISALTGAEKGVEGL